MAKKPPVSFGTWFMLGLTVITLVLAVWFVVSVSNKGVLQQLSPQMIIDVFNPSTEPTLAPL